jgi:ABC-type methionine transport system ATPase subunit
MDTTISPDNRIAQKRIRLRIPKQYHQEPVISKLISEHNLKVNITAALLGANGNGDGWFDLDLQGQNTRIQDALIYLKELDLEIWTESETDGW